MRTVHIRTWRFLALAFIFAISTIAATSIDITTAQAKQAYSGIVMDAKTGKVLYSHRGNARAYPASLTKMMTLYMLFEAMEKGKVSKKSRIRFSRHAASMQPSKLGVKAGRSISAEQAIYALVTKSANDAAVAVAEHLGGSESKFAAMMTEKARALGMKSTTFRNASGLPDAKQVTTARDMALLGIALREHFPGKYRYFSTRNYKFGKKNYRNHNRLLGKIRGYDGIKTGYTRASGFNLVSSVYDRRRSIVAVVMGGKSGKSRNAQMAKLIRTYLPKASRGRDRVIVARATGGGSLASLVKLVRKTKQVPEQRPEAAQTVARDNVVTASTEHQPPARSSLKSVKAQPAPSPTENVVSGWQVQIGAMPSKDSAIERLQNARAKLPGALDAVENYTETVQSRGTTLYRARFAGFSSKSAAWGACSKLKKASFDCLAILN